LRLRASSALLLVLIFLGILTDDDPLRINTFCYFLTPFFGSFFVSPTYSLASQILMNPQNTPTKTILLQVDQKRN
jgi:hypothetical protein